MKQHGNYFFFFINKTKFKESNGKKYKSLYKINQINKSDKDIWIY